MSLAILPFSVSYGNTRDFSLCCSGCFDTATLLLFFKGLVGRGTYRIDQGCLKVSPVILIFRFVLSPHLITRMYYTCIQLRFGTTVLCCRHSWRGGVLLCSLHFLLEHRHRGFPSFTSPSFENTVFFSSPVGFLLLFKEHLLQSLDW